MHSAVEAVNYIYFCNISALGTDLLPQTNLLASQPFWQGRGRVVVAVVVVVVAGLR